MELVELACALIVASRHTTTAHTTEDNWPWRMRSSAENDRIAVKLQFIPGMLPETHTPRNVDQEPCETMNIAITLIAPPGPQHDVRPSARTARKAWMWSWRSRKGRT